MTWNSVIAKNNLISDWIQDRIKIIGGLLVVASAINIWLTKDILIVGVVSTILGAYFLKKWAYGFIPIARQLDKIYRYFFGWKIGDEVVIKIPFGKKAAGTIVDYDDSGCGVTQYIVEINKKYETAFSWDVETYAYSNY